MNESSLKAGGGRMFVGGERNFSAARDIHISASRSWFAQLAGHGESRTGRTLRRWSRRAAQVASVAVSCCMDKILVLLPQQPLLIAAMLGLGASAITLLAIALV